MSISKATSFIALIPVLFLFAESRAQDYETFDLDSNNLISAGAAFRIVDNGKAVGLGVPLSGGLEHATVWTGSGSSLLPHLPDDDMSVARDMSVAKYIGEEDVVVGESDDVVPYGHLVKIIPHAAVWIKGQPIPLSSLVTGGDALDLHVAIRINGTGQILGWGRDANIPALHAFIFEKGIVTDLGTFTPDGNSEPFDMNNQGHVVGNATAIAQFEHAFLWKDGVMIDLHDPAVILGRGSTARAINEFGVIVGSADFVDDFLDFETATVWDHGVITNLGVLGGNQSYARDINDHGTIVGTSTLNGGGVHAIIYRDGKMEDLNDLIPPNSGWVLGNAHSINNDGRIVGEGFFNGALRPFLLVPDCAGGFQVYGAGCAGSGGFTPGLFGEGCPTPGGDISLVVVNGLGGGPGLLLFGTGFDTLPFKPGCDIQILPLLPVQVPLLLGGAGAGAGTMQIEAQLSSGLPSMLITMQALLKDAGGPGGFTVTNPLAMDIQ